MTEDEMIGWQHPHNGHGLKQTLGDREGQEIVMCCSSWDCRVRHDLETEQQHFQQVFMNIC